VKIMPSHGFYPENPEELKKMIQSFVKTGEEIKQIPNTKACVLPHAGYTFSGSIAMHTLIAAKLSVEKSKKVIVFGPDHTGTGTTDTPNPQEHSTDVQIPLIKSINSEMEIKQKIIGIEISFKDLKKIAEDVNKDTFYIASSDFIHFGPNYAYTPANGNIQEQVKWVKGIDSKLAKLVTQMRAEEFYNTVEQGQYTICGYKPITLVMLIANALGAKQGKIIEHKTSYEIMASDSFVDYMGIVFY